MAKADVWDCIVVGAGIIGSWTAYHLAENGQKTLVLEQFLLPTSRGSSSGQTRIIRSAYKEDYYVKMVSQSQKLWESLAKESNTRLFEPTGVLLIQRKDEIGVIEDSRASMDKHGVPYQLLTPGELANNYPQLVYSDQYKGMLDHTAGLLLAAKCLRAVQDGFRKRNGKIEDGVQVKSIIPGSTVTLITSKGNYYARKVVLAAGPWINDILKTLGIAAPIKTMPGLSVFFKEKNPSSPMYTLDKHPTTYTFLNYKPNDYRFVCSFPSVEYPGMVKLISRGEPPPYYCHPDQRDQRSNQDLVEIMKTYVREHLPGLEPNPSILEPCVYTMTPDKDYIIDRHPRHRNIIIGAGFSGHGFMRAPVITELIADLVLDRTPAYDLTPWRMDKHSTYKAQL